MLSIKDRRQVEGNHQGRVFTVFYNYLCWEYSMILCLKIIMHYVECISCKTKALQLAWHRMCLIFYRRKPQHKRIKFSEYWASIAQALYFLVPVVLALSWRISSPFTYLFLPRSMGQRRKKQIKRTLVLKDGAVQFLFSLSLTTPFSISQSHLLIPGNKGQNL